MGCPVTFHAFGLALAASVLLEMVAALVLGWVAATVVRPKAPRAGAMLGGAALLELALASLCCVRAEGSGASTGALASLDDGTRLSILDVVALGTPALHACAVALVVLAVRELASAR